MESAESVSKTNMSLDDLIKEDKMYSRDGGNQYHGGYVSKHRMDRADNYQERS
mgnify:CR=1 FL=1